MLMENLMSFVVVSQIRRARHMPHQISAHARRRLLRDIVEALELLADCDAVCGLFPNKHQLDRIVVSTSIGFVEIIGLADEQFANLMAQFDMLFAKVSQAMLVRNAPASFELH